MATPCALNRALTARLSQDGVETLVKVLSERFNSITVYVPGAGSKTIPPSDVLRVSDYTGIDARSRQL